ncbi:restriction endonuclease [Pseudomonas fluorescens]|uniref:restriction endonuclease n=1 Tax=Pseudomonas fluorescens TaxID=294 RepID=UPI0006918103|nr:restriction endonuclease [Pseudomonas fluorescens]TPV58676.1 restriction endonuclease [Pseudomonas fluorescens]
MSYQFYGANEPKSISCINVEPFLDKLSEITENFTVIPEQFFKVWNAIWWIDVTSGFSEFKEKLAEYALLCQLPPDLEQYLDCDISKLTIDQRFHVLMTLVESENVAETFEKYTDPKSFKWYMESFNLHRDGDLSEDVLERMSKGFRGFCYEIGHFQTALKSIVPKRDSIIQVFSTQNIRYATGELNFDKILKVMKSQFGEPHKGYIAYKGVIIERLLSQSSKVVVKPSSTAVGLSLEKAVFELYRVIGYAVSETSATGDFGIDILAQSNTEKIGIQCKNYAGTVGVEAVMQVHSGGHYYGCTRFIVYSASGFTPAALEMASKLKVELLIYKGA